MVCCSVFYTTGSDRQTVKLLSPYFVVLKRGTARSSWNGDNILRLTDADTDVHISDGEVGWCCMPLPIVDQRQQGHFVLN